MNLLPHPVASPTAKPLIDGGPRRKVVGQHAPRTTAAQHIEDSIEYGTPRSRFAPSPRRLRDEWLKNCTLPIVEVAGIQLKTLHPQLQPNFGRDRKSFLPGYLRNHVAPKPISGHVLRARFNIESDSDIVGQSLRLPPFREQVEHLPNKTKFSNAFEKRVG